MSNASLPTIAAGYRVDLLGQDTPDRRDGRGAGARDANRASGLAVFRRAWDHVHALSLYDWNGGGLQGMQFSSVINRLVCGHAERVHSWVDRVETTGECW